MTEEITPVHVTFLRPISVLFHQGINIDMRRSRCSILFLVKPNNYASSLVCYNYFLVFFSSTALCFCLFLGQWYHISFSSEGDTEVSIYTFRPVMTFLALEAEMCVLESLRISGGLVSGIKFQRDCSH